MTNNDILADTELREELDDIHRNTPQFSATVNGSSSELIVLTEDDIQKMNDEVLLLIKARDAAIRIDELEKWLPVADTWAKQEGIYGPQIQFKRRIAELSTPTDQKEKAE